MVPPCVLLGGCRGALTAQRFVSEPPPSMSIYMIIWNFSFFPESSHQSQSIYNHSEPNIIMICSKIIIHSKLGGPNVLGTLLCVVFVELLMSHFFMYTRLAHAIRALAVRHRAVF
jgi:hypothetical protein